MGFLDSLNNKNKFGKYSLESDKVEIIKIKEILKEQEECLWFISEYVYANGGKSKSNKYHSSPNAHKMEGSIKMTKQQAESQGYVACKKCY